MNKWKLMHSVIGVSVILISHIYGACPNDPCDPDPEKNAGEGIEGFISHAQDVDCNSAPRIVSPKCNGEIGDLNGDLVENDVLDWVSYLGLQTTRKVEDIYGNEFCRVQGLGPSSLSV